jgi:HEAT repeat protein/type 1 glutamine amidotransferase
MNRWVKVLTALLVIVSCLCLAGKVSSVAADEPSLKALIVTGQSNPWHKWEVSSPILEQLLEQTGLFKVDTATAPPGNEGIEDFKPDFAAYDVVVLDYDGYDRKEWSEQTKTAFVEYVRSGGGVVVYHGANNSFPKWKEFNEIIGLGGWGGRTEKDGPMVRWRDGKVVFDSTAGGAGSHGPAHEFQIVIREKKHPITRGLPEKWMHAKDELYAKLRGPAKNLTVLATAYSDPAKKEGTGEHEPILFTVNYGKGRVFHTTLGHARELPLPCMECVGFITTFQRGAEWAASGRVRQKVPEDFPTATEVRKWKGYKLPETLDELLGKIAVYEYGQSRVPLTELTDLVRLAHDSPQELKRIEKSFLKFLRSDATLAGKQFICQRLSIIGTEKSVPTLAAMLTKPETSDMARYALERIPAEAVDKALVSALGKTSGRMRVGIINSLGERRTREAVFSLSRLLGGADKETVRAAATALGKIGGPPAAKELGRALKQASGDLRVALADAYLMCADGFMASDHRGAAKTIYKELYEASGLGSVRSAALKGVVITGSRKKAFSAIIDAVQSDDEVMQAVAIELIRQVPGIEIVGAVSAEMPNLSPARQVQVLSVFADRGGISPLPAVLASAKSEDDSVRLAALKALASFGNPSTVVLLAQTAATAEGAEREAARESLYRLRGLKVNKAILGGILKAEPKVKVELIRSVGRRNLHPGVKILLKTVRGPDRDVRLESIKVLKDVAGPEHIQALVGILVNAKSKAELKEAEKTIVAVSRKSVGEDAATAVVLNAFGSVKDVNVRCSLLGVLGGIGGSKALGVLRESLENSDMEVQTAAIRALADWPNAEPAADLLKVAGSSDDEVQRTLALRGYIRLIGLDSDRAAEETVEMYGKAMELASNVSEKKMILSGLANVESFAALYMASNYLEDNTLQEEAGAAMIKIAETTRDSHPQQTKILLQMVVQTSKSQSMREQAQKIIEQICLFIEE